MTQTVDLESPAHKGSPRVLNIKDYQAHYNIHQHHAIYKWTVWIPEAISCTKSTKTSKTKGFHSPTLLGAWITSRKRPTGFLLLISIGLHSGQCHQAYKSSQISDTSETE